MSLEQDNTTSQDASAADSGEDLNNALSSNGETEFVGDTEAPKKNSTMVVVGLLVAALGGGFLLYKRGGPDAAEAAAAPEDQTTQVVSSFLDGGGKNVEMMQKMLRDTEKVVQQFLNYPSVKQIPLT